MLNDDIQLESHFVEIDECELKIRSDIEKFEIFLKRSKNQDAAAVDNISEANSEISRSSSSSSSVKHTVKLPKIEIKKFSGDPLNWKTFHDSFKSAVDENSSLNNVEKMNYLLTFLKGEAEATVKGLPLNNENYDIALEMLEARFGDAQVLISAHMNKLLSLQVVDTRFCNAIKIVRWRFSINK